MGMARSLPPRPAPRKRPTPSKKTPTYQRVANAPSADAEQVLALDDKLVPLVFQSNKRARRIIIRLDHFHARVVIVLPSRATRDQGRRFALLNKGWIRDRLAALPPPVPLRGGASVPYLGILHRIRLHPGERGTAWRENGEIHVAGRPEHSKRRIEDFLKREVAHLKEMNHGPRFWKLAAELTRADVEEARAWLHQEGPGLHRFG